MSNFRDIFEQYDWDVVKDKIYNSTPADVERALNSNKRSLDDFMALISPAAIDYLEEMAAKSRAVSKTKGMPRRLSSSNRPSMCSTARFSPARP